LESVERVEKIRNRSNSIILPRIGQPKSQKLSEEELERVGERVLKLQKMWYGPIGCSKSVMLQKVLMLKKVNRKRKKEEDGNVILKRFFRNRENSLDITPEIYVNSI
jgi:hypothetical protein